MRIAVTGHRPKYFNNDYNLTSPLIQRIEKRIDETLIAEGATHLISGMALGIDTLFAKIAVYKNLSLIAAVPFFGQEILWPQRSRELFYALIEYAKKNGEVVYVSPPGYSALKMQKRNEWLVNHCDKLIAVWDGSAGGTANCVAYADGKVPIIQINPKLI